MRIFIKCEYHRCVGLFGTIKKKGENAQSSIFHSKLNALIYVASGSGLYDAKPGSCFLISKPKDLFLDKVGNAVRFFQKHFPLLIFFLILLDSLSASLLYFMACTGIA